MSDLEKTIELYTSFGVKFSVKKREDFDSSYAFFGCRYRDDKYPDVDAILTISDYYFYSEHSFKDGKFVSYNINE